MKVYYAGVPEDKRTYSSVWNNDAIGTGHARSMINSDQAWSAKTNQAGEWMQLDLGEEKMVIGTAIQPRVDYDQYVTEYTVSTSVDGNTWTEVAGTYDGHASDIQENIFSGGAIVRARYVRFTVKTWSTHISLRGDVLVVDEAPGIIMAMHTRHAHTWIDTTSATTTTPNNDNGSHTIVV